MLVPPWQGTKADTRAEAVSGSRLPLCKWRDSRDWQRFVRECALTWAPDGLLCWCVVCHFDDTLQAHTRLVQMKANMRSVEMNRAMQTNVQVCSETKYIYTQDDNGKSDLRKVCTGQIWREQCPCNSIRRCVQQSMATSRHCSTTSCTLSRKISLLAFSIVAAWIQEVLICRNRDVVTLKIVTLGCDALPLSVWKGFVDALMKHTAGHFANHLHQGILQLRNCPENASSDLGFEVREQPEICRSQIRWIGWVRDDLHGRFDHRCKRGCHRVRGCIVVKDPVTIVLPQCGAFPADGFTQSG